MSIGNIAHVQAINLSFEEDYQVFLTLPREVQDWLNYNASFNYSSLQIRRVYEAQKGSVARTLYRLSQIDCAMLRLSAVEYTDINIELGLANGRLRL